AKAYAKASDRSLSELVGDLFGLLDVPEDSWPTPVSPAVRSLAGALEGVALDRADYRAHLERKHAWPCGGFSITTWCWTCSWPGLRTRLRPQPCSTWLPARHWTAGLARPLLPPSSAWWPKPGVPSKPVTTSGHCWKSSRLHR